MPRKAQVLPPHVFENPRIQPEPIPSAIQANFNFEEMARTMMSEMIKKPKHKRIITEERREVLREQLKKGRETRTRRKVDKVAPVAPVAPVTTVAPVAPVAPPLAKPLATQSTSNTTMEELLAQMKELTTLQKEKIETKRKREAEFDKKLEAEKEDDFLIFPTKKESKPPEQKKLPEQKPLPERENSISKPPISNVYYAPKPNNRIF